MHGLYQEKGSAGGELAVVQRRIESVLSQKAFVISLLNDLSVLHDKDLVGFTNGGEAVRHDKAGAARHHMGKSRLDLQLRAGVDGAGSFVQYEHGGAGDHGTCDAQQLLLPHGKTGPVFGQQGIIALGKALDKAVGIGGLGGGYDLLLRGIRAALGDILPYGTGTQPGIL